MRTLLLMFALTVSDVWLHADEGLWLPNALPLGRLKRDHNFEPDAKWAEHVRLSSVRLNSGGSGSFVSPDGLVMTNHHVGSDALQKLSTEKNNYVRDGFTAATREGELKTPDLEINVLVEIVDVTDRVNAGVKPEMTPGEAFAARRRATAEIEKQSLDATGLRSDVVTLYNGGAYHLYRYKRYTDVRLVFAPETSAAFFGGDPDNFEYPRYCLDVCFFRAYENGQPAKTPHYLRWSAKGPTENDLVFVSGHPGRTERQHTVAQLMYARDFSLPHRMDRLRRWEVSLQQFASRSPENARICRDELFGVQNSRKARLGMLAGLQDPALMARKAREEKALRDGIAADANLMAAVGTAFEDIAAAQDVRRRELYPHLELLEAGFAFNTTYFGYARTLVRLAEEQTKPDGERLREFNEAGRESLELELFSEAPIYAAFEQHKLTDSLSLLAELLGGEHPLVLKVLAGQSPAARAGELIAGTKLADVKLRRQLAEGGAAAIAASEDPMIRLARLVDAEARALRKTYEDKVEGVERSAFNKIARARFAVMGTDTYPDATFTLRLSYGVVKGFSTPAGTVPTFTTLGGKFERAALFGNKDPFELPASWVAAKDKLDKGVPYNFVCTVDIIGGNSGSPVVNRDAELVGLIFDGNLDSLVWDYSYTDVTGRSVAVDSRGIIEVLRKVYSADKLVAELLPAK